MFSTMNFQPRILPEYPLVVKGGSYDQSIKMNKKTLGRIERKAILTATAGSKAYGGLKNTGFAAGVKLYST